jgi:hypothetical protein
MKIELKNITVRELANGYSDNGEGGVVGYNGKLDIRPPYQREFVYSDKQRNAVIDTISKNFPLNVMYWAVRDDGNYEIIDGQQRTISICQFIHNIFNFDKKYFQNLQLDEQERYLNYELTIYLCEGTPTEKLKWFETINIAGEKLTPQEMKNAVFHGPWVTDAKKWFSKTNGPAFGRGGKDYLVGSANRQEYLETVIKWFSNNQIEEYMGKNQNNPNAKELWQYFENVIDWTEKNFKEKKIMMGVEWGELYNKYKEAKLDPQNIAKEANHLLAFDDTITNQKGIYPFILTREEKYLNIRKFSDNIKTKVYKKQNEKCNLCNDRFDLSQMHADHISPWHKGGKSIEDNCQLLCIKCNLKKSGK